jgi:hypothetical protein
MLGQLGVQAALASGVGEQERPSAAVLKGTSGG